MKKFYIYSIFVLLLLHVSICAQKRAVKETVKTDVWKEFIPEDKSFKILFPKPPEILWLGNINYVSTVSQTEKYSLYLTDYPAPITDDMQRQMELELPLPLPRIPKDFPLPGGYNLKKVVKIVWSQGYSGVEFATDLKSENITNTHHFFIVKQRAFNLMVTTPLLGKLPLAARQ